MTEQEHTLWQKIAAFEFDDSNSEFTFTDRLCRENGWKMEYAVRAVQEYKKFMFLICIGSQPLTPSDQVDQVWHLHLLYTRSYWIDFCKETLGRDVHHGPTKGGEDDRSKFRDWYAVTKEFYRDTFGVQPPSDIWPSSKVRFGEIRFRRVNLHRNWIIPKPKKND